MDPWSLNTLAICFGGGIVGAALGGLFSFVICALAVFAGCLCAVGGGSEFLLLQVGLGPIFGPHVGGFAAGVAASNYAAFIRKNHPGCGAKDILAALMPSSWDVLLVGGIFAVLGHAIVQFFGTLPIVKEFDVIALSVAATAIISRLIFVKEMPWGSFDSIKKNCYLSANDSISWVSWTLPLPKMLIFGLGAGLLSAGLAMTAKEGMAPLVAQGQISAAAAFVVPLILGWAVAGISLIGLQLGTGAMQQVPVWHAQAILSAMAYLYFGNILIVAGVALAATLLQELMARMFWNHGSTHIDPPACAIALGTFALNMLK